MRWFLIDNLNLGIKADQILDIVWFNKSCKSVLKLLLILNDCQFIYSRYFWFILVDEFSVELAIRHLSELLIFSNVLVILWILFYQELYRLFGLLSFVQFTASFKHQLMPYIFIHDLRFMFKQLFMHFVEPLSITKYNCPVYQIVRGLNWFHFDWESHCFNWR